MLDKSQIYRVTEKAMRPASPKRRCFFCQERVGGIHKPDCVLITKKVSVRLTIEYDIEVAADLEPHTIEFARNEGSWCKDNLIRELEELGKENGCLCHAKIRYDYLKDASGPYLSE